MRTRPVYCRECAAERLWIEHGSANTTGPHVSWYACATCGHVRIQMTGDVTDAVGLCEAVLDTKLNRSGKRGELLRDDRYARFDRDDCLGYLMEGLYLAYRRFKPELGVPFLAYGTAMLRHRLNRYYASWLGPVERPKLLAGALSTSYATYDDHDDPDSSNTGVVEGGLEIPDGTAPGNAPSGGLADLGWTLLSRDLGADRLVAEEDPRANARASRRDPAPA